MKRGRQKIVSGLFILLLVMALIPLASAGFFSDLWGKITGYYAKGLGANITISSMSIVYVNTTSVTLNSGPNPTGVLINFTAYDGAGVQYLNDSSVSANLTIGISGEQNRTNASCYRTLDFSTNYVNYTCNVTMWWFDSNGTWNVTVFIKDNFSNVAINASQAVVLNALTGFDLNPTNLTWPTLIAGAINQTSNNDPLIMNNTGNMKIGINGWPSNVSINATHLTGETNGNWRMFASNFTVSNVASAGGCQGAAGNCFECDTSAGRATNMSFATYTNVSYANLTKGNFTINDGLTGQERLSFCLRIVDTGLTAQSYSTVGNGSWVVQI